MIKEIKYTGYSANPSDYDCADGDLAASLGLINEDGALRSVLPPAVVMSLSSSEEVKYIHKTSSICHYIIFNSNGSLTWRTLSSETRTLLLSFSINIYGFNAIGNTLVVLASDGIHYFLWKGDDGYLYLGTDMPECSISFGLQGEMIRSDEFKISFSSLGYIESLSEFDDDNKTTITEQVLAQVNVFIADNATNAGKFIYPFFVRYAYRLYDGTLTRHSAPVLMIASTEMAPHAFWTNRDDASFPITKATIEIAGMVHSLDYAVIDGDDLDELIKWNDIISSVDVFISAPIYNYDQSGECTNFGLVDIKGSVFPEGYSVCKHTNQAMSQTSYPLKYQSHSFLKLYTWTFDTVDFKYPSAYVELPRKSDSAIEEDIKNCSQFYFLKSINLDSLETERTVIEIDDDYLDSLVAREVMTDDYDSRDSLCPSYSFAYNNRLNVANIKKRLFSGQTAISLFNYTDGYTRESGTVSSARTVSIYIYIRQDNKEIVVKANDAQIGWYSQLLYIFYPNIYAYKALIFFSDGQKYEVTLTSHDFLNGAYYFGGWANPSLSNSSTPTVSSDSERTIEMSNKIYSSEAGNPYYFPVLGVNTVGTGDIVGVSSAARALSQGQFGSFPLYAFTTEGIWALEVSETGTYSAKQVIARDVCISEDSITQIDTAVLFATDRGIMLISGSETQCISDTLDYEEVFTLADLPNSSNLVEIYNEKAGEDEQITISDIAFQSFKEFLSACQMVYDYVHQRIIVYNPNESYAYVYSMKSKMWGMMQSNISSGVNSYPDALAMTSDNTLVNFSESDESSATGLLVTRPFKIDDPNMFKTINTIIQRGHFDKDHISQVLYGSNDLYNWFPIWSSTDKYMRGFSGSPYKAFRLVVFCDFGKGESLSGFTVQFAPRMTNRLR